MMSSDQQNTVKNNDADLVIIDYQDLLLPSNKSSTHDKLHPLLTKAFGISNTNTTITTSSLSSVEPSLGLIAIRNIPSFLSTKNSFLPLAHKLISLPENYLDKNLTDESSMYNAGWSYGKEKLKLDQPDLSKGSFYFNPVTDVPGTEEDRKLYPASYPVNKWPEEEMIPNFEALGKRLGLLMKDVVALLALHIDEYVKMHCKEYDACMGMEMKNTEKVKGRLLYYFPHEKERKDNDGKSKENEEYDSWIGWHNDSGFLTALAGDVYLDHDTGDIIPKEEIDPNAGLYIQDRHGCIKHILIPDDCMAIQIGECLQIVTGGYVVATPHCVRGADPNWICNKETEMKNRQDSICCSPSISKKKRRVARISFPCFVDTIPSFPLNVPKGRSRDDILISSVVGCAKVPPLEDR
jgi:isopenicillin N synthase-like dioxygenase